MARKRRKYSIEFKREAVRLVQEEGLSNAQVGSDLGVDRSVIRTWVKKAESGELEATPHSTRQAGPSMEEELRRLRRENAILREERDILKKAAAFFAKESQ